MLVQFAAPDLHEMALDPANWSYSAGDGEATFWAGRGSPQRFGGHGLESGQFMVSAAANVFVPIRLRADDKASTTLLAALLVLALLLCHGAMGGVHQLAPQLAASAQASASGPVAAQALALADHAPALPDAGSGEERGAGYGEGHTAPYLLPPGFYMAALLVVLLVSLHWPALRAAASLSPAGFRAVRWPLPAAFLRGYSPTASSLQVFRL